MNLLLQIMEEGMVTDTNGVKINFRNTIVIMTSNVGAHILQKNQGLGFGMDDFEDTFEKTKTKIMEEAKRVFKPEFLNRINSIIVFHQLLRKHLRKIIDIEMRGIIKRLGDRHMHLEVSDAAKDFLIEQGVVERKVNYSIQMYLILLESNILSIKKRF